MGYVYNIQIQKNYSFCLSFVVLYFCILSVVFREKKVTTVSCHLSSNAEVDWWSPSTGCQE
jgi:hypothetical protein